MELPNEGRSVLYDMIRVYGPAEVLRAVGQYIATHHPCASEGDDVRVLVCGAARRVRRDMPGIEESQ